MLNPLVAHAYQNVWCDPAMDFEHIFEPTRITSSSGVMGECTVMWRTVKLPTSTDRYHVYTLGQVNPQTLGLVAKTSQWMTLAAVMAERLTYIQVYTAEGLLFPLAQSYIMYTRDRTLILAVKEQPNIAPLSTTPLFFRFYANAFFGSRRSDGQVNNVESIFYSHTDINSALAFQHQVSLLVALQGYVTLTLNGRYINGFVPSTLQGGDLLEAVYDSSVKKVIDFNVTDLSTFESIKDAKTKYLLHYSDPQTPDVLIDYRDDCDLWLIKKNPIQTGSTWDGLYFHKNNDDAFRQVTHRDYSVCVPYVATYMGTQASWTDLSELTLRLVIRSAGFDRPLVPEANQIHELYKLPDDLIVKAMLGIDSTVSNWRAPTLENSQYIDIMDANLGAVTLPMVESAYGYNAIATVLAESPTLVDERGYVDLPVALQNGSTMYEYDANGVLLGWYPHVAGAQYQPVYEGCKLVEGWVGSGSAVIPQVMDMSGTPIQAGYSYRYYIATRKDDGYADDSTWQDVTHDSTKWTTVNGKVQWLVDTGSYVTCVKSDASHLIYTLDLTPMNGLLQFSIGAQITYPTGVQYSVLAIPTGQLDLFLNGYALVENLDYFVQWPQVIVVNKAYLADSATQSLTIRASGFCRSTMKRPPVAEYGFLRWGVLSHNDTFNVRDDHVQRVIANGRTFDKSQLVFAEDQASIAIPAVPNGSPYQVQDLIVPLRNYCDQDTYTLLTPAQTVDQAVSDYLTLKIPETIPGTLDVITDKYAIYSPFCSTIIHDMINGLLSMSAFEGQYSDRDIKQALANYTYLLSYDPTQKSMDLTHVAIHPTNLLTVLTLNIYQWKFISRAVKIFLNGDVDLTKFVAISENWL